jgi:hypothetical protein
MITGRKIIKPIILMDPSKIVTVFKFDMLDFGEVGYLVYIGFGGHDGVGLLLTRVFHHFGFLSHAAHVSHQFQTPSEPPKIHWRQQQSATTVQDVHRFS